MLSIMLITWDEVPMKLDPLDHQVLLYIRYDHGNPSHINKHGTRKPPCSRLHNHPCLANDMFFFQKPGSPPGCQVAEEKSMPLLDKASITRSTPVRLPTAWGRAATRRPWKQLPHLGSHGVGIALQHFQGLAPGGSAQLQQAGAWPQEEKPCGDAAENGAAVAQSFLEETQVLILKSTRLFWE